MSVPSSMVHRSGDVKLAVRTIVSDDAFHEPTADVPDAACEDANIDEPSSSCFQIPEPAATISGETQQPTKELPECKVRRNYKCPNCDFFTQNPRKFLYHQRDVHHQKLRVYECPHCIYASKHFQKLLRHSKMVHNTSEGVTAEETSSKKSRRRSTSPVNDAEQEPDALQDQIEEENGIDDVEMLPEDPVLFKCSVCAFTSRNRVQLSKHEREEHIKTKFFRCSKCTYATHIKARFTKHVKYHSMPMIKCDLCDFRTPYKWNLDRHCKNHNGKGAFRCSACNFTADIKQSLTVHEMNHHVPPVGQAAGLGVGRRRNKVGASDTTAAEEAAAAGQDIKQIAEATEVAPEETPRTRPKIKITPRKKVTSSACSTNGVINSEKSQGKQSDFIHPDDIVQHSNGKVYIKNKCKLCKYKTPWDSEMAKHEKNVHNIERELSDKPKKTVRPVPNLIPIPTLSVLKLNQQKFGVAEKSEPMMSQKDMNDICSRSANSALKDLASLFSSEDVFKSPSTSKVPDLIPASIFTSANKSRIMDSFKQKNASFFDRLKEKLELGTTQNLVCDLCGHESKCLTEQAKHQKCCGKVVSKVPNIPVHNISASRCQYCRQRCKSSADLFNHLQTCAVALKFHEMKQEDDTSSEHENELKIDEDRQSVDDEFDNKPHPMENKVFVWNDIMVPMDIEVDDSNYEYTGDKIDDNGSLDLSIRTQSPATSENSYLSQENNNSINTNNNLPVIQHSPVQTPVTEKIPTHGNDISVAQHKRVFKCPHCTFWASTASRFHVHIVGHLNKKPFECSLCSYRSNWRWDITKHIKLKSVRDQAHESAKVLMTDETGRRNYTKYNKYLTEIPLSSLQSSNETSGGSGTRPRHDKNSSASSSKSEKQKIPTSGDFNSLLKVSLKSPPSLKAVDKQFLAIVAQEKKKSHSDSKRTLFKCKKCNFRDASRDILLQHVKGHYQALDPQEHFLQQAIAAAQLTVTPTPLSLVTDASSTGGFFTSQDLSLRGTSPDRDEASVNNSHVTKGGSTTTTNAPFRCGHCNQVSNWKHVIQRHCRLKHNGDIRVVSTKNGQLKIEVEEQLDEPDEADISQPGVYKCKICPYYSDICEEFQKHITGHLPNPENGSTCSLCNFSTSVEKDLAEHFKLHSSGSNDHDGKKFKCTLCPYVTNSKSQYTYHKQFHKDRGGQYTCNFCTYNVSKRHLLHQHLKVHGINSSPTKQCSETEDIEEDSEVPSTTKSPNDNPTNDIPLVWVSKDGKFWKMFKCRYCPHVNTRKVNIQEHEKMHGIREKNPNSTRLNDVEHKCNECNYVCNNAGVLSSHSKVHQGFYGVVHCLVDSTKSDEEQIKELTKALGSSCEGIDTSDFLEVEMEEVDVSPEKCLYFCKECPARFLKEDEFNIHRNFHNSNSEYKCKNCSYATDNSAYLQSHFKVHTFEYQDRTKVLKSFHVTNPNYPEPDVKQKVMDDGEITWCVDNSGKSELEQKNNILASFLSKPLKSSVPLSGTDLFQHRSEAQLRHNNISPELDTLSPIKNKSPDILLTHLMRGNPDFIYQTYIKNGRTKEKRYKCHKCPSAFEKREQYKIHLGLHGAQQKYNCEYCDYSVKYYANYVQHLKKHKFNDDAQAAKRIAEEVSEEEEDVISEITGDDENNLPSGNDDQQSQGCPHCPYTHGVREVLDNHLKRHECVSGIKSTFVCNHCDYSVPEAHLLRDHTKLHLIPNTCDQITGDDCDNDKLTSKASENGTELFFDEKMKEEFFDVRGDDEKFNNNKGEKMDVQTRELVVNDDVSDLNVETTNIQMEVS